MDQAKVAKLLAVHVNKRRPFNDDEPDGYRESDRDYVANNFAACVALLDILNDEPD